MDLNYQAELVNCKTVYDAIILSINSTCAEWSLMPIDVKVLVSQRVWIQITRLISIKYTNVVVDYDQNDGFTIGIAGTPICVDTKESFVKGELPFKIMMK